MKGVDRMMKQMGIEDQVCSLDLAKRLKELGVEQDSVWYWKITEAGAHYVSLRGQIAEAVRYARDRKWPPHIDEIVCSAFTVAELGEKLKGKAALPVWTNKEMLKELAKLGVPDHRATDMLLKEPEGHFYWDDPLEVYKTPRADVKEADARAKTLIDLLEVTGRSILDGKVTVISQEFDLLEARTVVKQSNGKKRKDI